MGDLNILLRTRLGQGVLLGLFFLALVMDADMLLSPVLIGRGLIRPNGLSQGMHTGIAAIETIVMVGATILWLAMLCACTFDASRRIPAKLVWGLVFLLTTWFGAQFFYLFIFRRSMRYALKPDRMQSSIPPAC
jgi:hypothetical protein